MNSFWVKVLDAANMSNRTFLWLMAAFLISSLVLFILVPAERQRIRTAVLIYALAFVGLLIAGLLHGPGTRAEQGGAFRWVSWGALLVKGIAVITVGSVLLFEVLMEAARLKPPRILRDLLVKGIAVITVGSVLLFEVL